MLWLRCVTGRCCKLCEGHHRHHSIWVLAFRRHPLLPKTTHYSCIHQNEPGWLPGVFPADGTGHESWHALTISPFICWLLQGAAAAWWVPGSCCFLLLLLHGSYRSESFLISKGTHSQISTPPKIGTHSYFSSPAKIIKRWGKKHHIFGSIWNMVLTALDGWKSRTISSAIAGLQAKTTPDLQCRWSSKS